MPRRILVVAFVCVVLVVGSWALWYGMRQPAPGPGSRANAAPTVTARTEPSTAVAPAPVPPPEPRLAAGPRAPRRAPAPNNEPSAPEPAVSTMGTLHIDSDVTGAQVFIDRNFIGVTPITWPEIAVGAHRLNIVAPGYDSIAETVDVEPGPRDLQFNFNEARLDAGIDVVHKHRIGSCKGRLVATPQGLRYDTNDKGDRFSVSLDDLEVFQVDYLAKVLQVKLKKGKRYEFTDPGAANADRLFVFHRDVDKVRERLTANR